MVLMLIWIFKGFRVNPRGDTPGLTGSMAGRRQNGHAHFLSQRRDRPTHLREWLRLSDLRGTSWTVHRWVLMCLGCSAALHLGHAFFEKVRFCLDLFFLQWYLACSYTPLLLNAVRQCGQSFFGSLPMVGLS